MIVKNVSDNIVFITVIPDAADRNARYYCIKPGERY